jgi:lipoprotein-anchoring transpeptidase ErfK/SrfK
MYEQEPADEGRKITAKQGMKFLLIIVGIALIVSFFLMFGVADHAAGWRERVTWLVSKPDPAGLLKRVSAEKLDKHIATLQKEIASDNRKLQAMTPRQAYLVVNTANNTFRLMKGQQLVREGVCSTGSYTILKAGDDQKWVFETPRGLLRVQGKQESPVWVKPDWAFVEEGLPVPPAGHSSRYERGVLGDYKLMLGRGYLIHGTLYKRFLGMAVTHGCIRLGDDDLEAVYKNLHVGSKVFIY